MAVQDGRDTGRHVVRDVPVGAPLHVGVSGDRATRGRDRHSEDGRHDPVDQPHRGVAGVVADVAPDELMLVWPEVEVRRGGQSEVGQEDPVAVAADVGEVAVHVQQLARPQEGHDLVELLLEPRGPARRILAKPVAEWTRDVLEEQDEARRRRGQGLQSAAHG